MPKIFYGNYGFFLTTADFERKEHRPFHAAGYVRQGVTHDAIGAKGDGLGWVPNYAKIESEGSSRTWLEKLSIADFEW